MRRGAGVISSEMHANVGSTVTMDASVLQKKIDRIDQFLILCNPRHILYIIYLFISYFDWSPMVPRMQRIVTL